MKIQSLINSLRALFLSLSLALSLSLSLSLSLLLLLSLSLSPSSSPSLSLSFFFSFSLSLSLSLSLRYHNFSELLSSELLTGGLLFAIPQFPGEHLSRKLSFFVLGAFVLHSQIQVAYMTCGLSHCKNTEGALFISARETARDTSPVPPEMTPSTGHAHPVTSATRPVRHEGQSRQRHGPIRKSLLAWTPESRFHIRFCTKEITCIDF